MPYQLKHKVASEQTPQDDRLWEGDYLNHQYYVPILARMVAGQQGPLTMALNSRWGTGKTFFLKRLEKYYAQEGGRAIYFNAWEDDCVEDPLVALTCRLNQVLGYDVNKSIGNSIKEAIVPLLKHGGLSIFKSIMKNKVGLDIDALSPDELESRSEQLMQAYKDDVASREHLKNAFERLGTAVSIETKKPLLIIVDELDRSRPTYAIELLERIKHLFAIPGIVFVLGIDKEQLGRSISAVYGEIDIEGYLHRLIDVETHLPRTDKDLFISHLFTGLHLAEFLSDAGSNASVNSFAAAFTSLANSQDLSLREIEQAVRKFSLIAFAKDREAHSWVILAAVAVVVYLHKDRDFYDRFISLRLRPNQLVDTLFPSFDLTDPATARPGATLILYLYKVYYRASDDAKFVEEFDNMLESAYDKNAKLSDKDFAVLPHFARDFSTEDIKCFFKRVTERVGYLPSLKELMKEIDEAMHMFNEF